MERKIWRGVAIISIMLHNFLHFGFGFTQENEMSYLQEHSDAFLKAVLQCPQSVVGEFLSFLGWIGVPVFVFLTGYGLCKNYPPHVHVRVSTYLKHSYLKLFFLLLPAILFFVYIDFRNGQYEVAAKHIFSLTMLHNLDYPDLHFVPGVYWYFSLTFQFYVVWLFFRNQFCNTVLFGISLISIIVLGVIGKSNMPNVLSIYKHCVTGWFPIFALGVWCAKKEEELLPYYGMFADLGLFIVFLILSIMVNMNYYTWLLSPFAGLIFFYCLARFTLGIPSVRTLLKFIGKYSAFIFVSHPIARQLYYILNCRVNLDNCSAISFYLIATILLSICYKKIYCIMMTVCNKKHGGI